MITGLCVAVIAVGFAAIFVRIALEDASALAIAFWRTLGGALALAPFAVRTRRRAAAPLTAVRHRQLAWSGAFLALHFACFLGSLALTTVASAVTLVNMSPLFVALGGLWFLGERTTRRAWTGIAITLVGAITIGLADAVGIELGGRALLGDLLALGGAVTVSGYLLLGRSARREIDATVYSAIVFTWAAAVLVTICLVLGIPLTGYSTSTWLAILGIVIGPQLLGHTVFNALLSTVPAATVSTVTLGEPVVSTLLAWLLLAELPAPLFWVGAPLVLLGVFVATRAAARESPHDQLRV